MGGWAAAVQAGIELTGALIEKNRGIHSASKRAIDAQATAINMQNARAQKLFELYLQDTYPLEKDRNEAARRLLPTLEEAERTSLVAGTRFSENAAEIAAPMQRQLAKDIKPDIAYARRKAKADVAGAFDEESQAQELRRTRAGISGADPTAMAAQDKLGLARASASAMGQNEAAERERQAGIGNQFRFVDSARMPGSGINPNVGPGGMGNQASPFATTGSNVAGNLALAGMQNQSDSAAAESLVRGINSATEAFKGFQGANTGVSGGTPSRNSYSFENAQAIRGV
jgi:hypothetical protein